VIAPAVGFLQGAGGTRLRWFRWDAPSSRAGLVLVHGFGDHVGRYLELVRVLTERGYSVFAYDSRGHGGSEGKRGHADRFELYLEDLDRMWAEARRVLRGDLSLYGHSFGGLTSIRWLQTRRTLPSAAILSAPWLAIEMEVPGWKLLASKVLLRVAPSLTISSGASRPDFLTRDPVRAADYDADPLVHHRISARFYFEARKAQAAALAQGLPEGIPVLLLVPGDDRLVHAGTTLAWAREKAPRAEIRIREAGRHELHNDLDRDVVLAAAADWLDTRTTSNP
jgi:alpha-beta hydrolase superfamily lysophospholipase